MLSPTEIGSLLESLLLQSSRNGPKQPPYGRSYAFLLSRDLENPRLGIKIFGMARGPQAKIPGIRLGNALHLIRRV